MKYKYLYITAAGHFALMSGSIENDLMYKYLCSNVFVDYVPKKLSEYLNSSCACNSYACHSYKYDNMCKSCLKKLPKKIQDKIKFDYIVYKLKDKK